jgi:hypothetical protein
MRLKYTLTLLCLWLALPTPSFATDFVIPDQKITGGETPIPLGEDADLYVAAPKEKPPHLIGTSYKWKVFEVAGGDLKERGRIKTTVPEDGGSNCWFSVGIVNKKVVAMVVVTHLYAVKEGDKTVEVGTRTVVLTQTVIIGEVAPPKPPEPPKPNPPDPVPPAPPIIPDGKFKLGQLAYDSANNLVFEDRAATAKKLANSYRGVVAAYRAGTIKSIQDFLVKTSESNTVALSSAESVRWKAWALVFEDKSYALYSGGSLKTLDDFADAWTEIAVGLEVVK